MESIVIYHIVPSKSVGLNHLSIFKRVLKDNVSKLHELDNGQWFYSIPKDSTLKTITQSELLGLVTQYVITEERPKNIIAPERFLILDFVKSKKKNLSEIDINKDLNIKLKKNVVFDSKGWAVKTQYFENVNVSICEVTGLQIKDFQNLVMEEAKTYSVDENKNLLNRNLKIGYYTDRENIEYLVDKTKYYTEYDERIESEEKRRENVINAVLYPFLLGKFKELSISTDYADTQTKLNNFKNSIFGEVSQFVQFSDYETLTNKISILGYDWLETKENNITLRTLIIDLINNSKL